MVQHSKLNYDIDTLQIVLCCVKSFLFRIGNTVEEDCLFSTCSQTTSEVLVLCDKIYLGQRFYILVYMRFNFFLKNQNLSDVREQLTGPVLFSGRGLGKKLSILQSKALLLKGGKVQDV